MKTKVMAALAALAALVAAGSVQAVMQTAGNGFKYELLDFSGTPGNALNPVGCAAVGSGNNRDYRCDPMVFADPSNTRIGGDLTATSPGNSIVYENLDKNNNQYGLGVVSDDKDKNYWISGSEKLTLTFENLVNLVGYHVYQVGNAAGSPDQFKVSVDDGAWVYRSFESVVFSSDSSKWLKGTTFSFMAADDERFYVGAAKVISAIPEPETYALMLAGLGVVGFAARRRRAKH